ncbi:hypothetical protein GQ55_9G157000 [Panicum hallii var. hallii]|uniref:Uncharacterized protein n=1 Tax=Panicum hallii var. hallii TaxID=1504633 RepID=A0A2T7C3L9_9POAL|nr:hypothetical protein GQ55_9G157000 [Panicum hallii var. hallii]
MVFVYVLEGRGDEFSLSMGLRLLRIYFVLLRLHGPRRAVSATASTIAACPCKFNSTPARRRFPHIRRLPPPFHCHRLRHKVDEKHHTPTVFIGHRLSSITRHHCPLHLAAGNLLYSRLHWRQFHPGNLEPQSSSGDVEEEGVLVGPQKVEMSLWHASSDKSRAMYSLRAKRGGFSLK